MEESILGSKDSANMEDIDSPCESATNPVRPLSPATITVPELPTQNDNIQHLPESSLEKLPTELLVWILQYLSSPDQLYKAIITCRAIYDAFRSSMVSILASVMEQAIHPAVLPLAILICEESGDKDRIPARRDVYLSVSNNMSCQLLLYRFISFTTLLS